MSARASHSQSNRTKYDYDANNRIMASPGKVWAYDADGNPTSINAETSTQELFFYDSRNRMRGYANAATSVAASYLYDPFGRRFKKTVNGVTTWFLWDGDRLIAQFNGTGERERRYAYGEDSTLREQIIVSESGEDVQEVHADHLGAPRGLTGSSAEVVWRAAYQAFGSATPNEDPDGDLAPVALAWRFPGQTSDSETSLYYNHHRTYSPSIGRYLEVDPIGHVGGFNGFIYANDSPTAFIDRRGLCAGAAWMVGSGSPGPGGTCEPPGLLQYTTCYLGCILAALRDTAPCEYQFAVWVDLCGRRFSNEFDPEFFQCVKDHEAIYRNCTVAALKKRDECIENCDPCEE